MTITQIVLDDQSRLSPAMLPVGDGLRILLVPTGAAQVATRDNILRLPAGTALVFSGPTPPDVTAIGDTTVTLISTPTRHPHITPADPLTVTPDNPLLTVVTALIPHILAVTDGLNWTNRHAIENMLTDALRHLIADTTRHHRSPRTPDPFITAITKITASSADPDLTAEAISRHANISLRQLERAFQKRGTTITREIRRARIDHAQALLIDHTRHTLTVNEIARSVGFSNNSSLARAMSAEGHATPHHTRNLATRKRSS